MDYAKRGISSPISEGWGAAGRVQEDKKFLLSLAKCKVLCRLGLLGGVGLPGEGGGGGGGGASGVLRGQRGKVSRCSETQSELVMTAALCE